MRTDTKLTERLKSGDREALFSLMSVYYNDLFRYCMAFTADKDLSKDIISQFFLHVWDHRGKFSAAGDFKAYLVVAFKRFTIHYLRKISRQLDFSGMTTDNVEYPYEDYLVAWQQNDAVKRLLKQAITSLSPRQQELVQLRFYEQLSYDEIAAKTSLSIRTVYNKLHEALKKLRSHTSLQKMRSDLYLLLTVLVAIYHA